MGTSSLIGIRCADGAVIGCYVHYDGYPGNMMGSIKDYIESKTLTGLVLLIVRAQEKGGLRSLTRDEEPSLLNDDPCVVDEQAWEDNYFDVSYKYLVDYKTGHIEVYDKQSLWDGSHG